MQIDYKLLGEDALIGLATAFIHAEQGNEVDDEPLTSKIDKVLSLIRSGELIILFSELTEEAHLYRKESFQQKQTGR